ncbi:transient receptor potential cation channel subfamily M member 2 [Gadus macrocephalus]|uniref:transient receptor potential cation channel subfamily M member 2 n=1 Tax=Gadus macrocephalus TaxID=80720 RepID=UPI0028CB5D09|nr:transient receptor potential cation channel subfamily M member 2 [Gadus macrocephalus]
MQAGKAEVGYTPSIPSLTLSVGCCSKLLSLCPPSQRYAAASWFRDNIKKKECLLFAEGKKEGFCQCGYPRSLHEEAALKPAGGAGQSWDRHQHTHEVPTDAFGEVVFGGLGQKTSKYARVSIDTTPEVLYKLLTEQWGLTPPNLLISVTGGAKNFYLRARLKSMFHRGLIKVAKTTGAWIMTGGSHAGVMKYVGQAVRDQALSSRSTHGQMVAIGMASWGAIHNRQALVQKGLHLARYSMDVQGQGRLTCLDDNHSHFLLVDDGTHGRYGVEIELRSRLEKFISQKPLGNSESGLKIPVVCVVLDGGPGTLNTIFNAMLNGTPCVILEGSGRIADVIAQVAGWPLARVTIALIHQLMSKFFGSEYNTFSALKIIEWTKKIQDIIRMSHLLTVFRISEEQHGELDVAILLALLKVSRNQETVARDSWQRQLELAVAWNRVDIAENEIFTEESQWKSRDLEQAMFSSLTGLKPEFVRLLLENGVSLGRVLAQDDALCDLYNHLPGCFFLSQTVRRVHRGDRSGPQGLFVRGRAAPDHGARISMSHVSEEVRHLLGSFTEHIYPSKGVSNEGRDEYSITIDPQEAGGEGSSEAPRDPGTDLFLWAVLQNNRELAQIGWEQCKDCMCAALAASKILKKMAEEVKDAEETEQMMELANIYEKHAIGVFSECHSCDEERAQKLLIRVSPSWGRTTCIRLALEADDKGFVAHHGVQMLLTQIWCGELAVENPLWRVFLSMVFFPLIFTGFLGFRRDEVIQREAQRTEDIITMETMTGSVRRTNGNTFEPPSTKQLQPLRGCSRLASLYGSPLVKFYWNILSYFGFLFLFAVVLMVDFQSAPSWLEVLLYIWLATLVCEEVRQLFHDPDGFGFSKKAKLYISDLWNILDVLSILLFIMGLAFRLTTELFYAGKILLCIDYIVFCLRLMAIFTISKTLGPKIIIVKRMVMDLFFFMFLLSIWVVAYGVAKQGILIHNEGRLDWILRGAVYEPYLIIFGNVPTNIDNAEFDIESCTIDGSNPLKPKCPLLNDHQMPAFPPWLTIFMLCVYLLFANILLLNLLIAIFNYTFQVVHDNTDSIWKFQRYELIKEYHTRPAAPPPLILFSHLYLLIRRALLCRPAHKSSEFKVELLQAEEEELLSWEALMKDNYLLSTRQEQSQSIERRINDTAQKVSTLAEGLEQNSSAAAVAKHLARLEEQVSQSSKALQWIMDSLQTQGLHAGEEPPQLTAESEPPGAGSGEGEREEAGFHVKARLFSYPGAKGPRFPVPEEMVPWEVTFGSYDPPTYDPEESEDCLDGFHRKALEKHRNPGGRTGLIGRGALPQLGANPVLELVLTRWRNQDRSALEFLAVWDQFQESWALPGGPVQSENHLPAALEKMMGKQLYQYIQEKVEEGTKVFEGYVDDARNTDNSWVEVTVLALELDRTGPLMTSINLMVAHSRGSAEVLEWQEVSGRARLSAYQRDSLLRVAELHHRKF